MKRSTVRVTVRLAMGLCFASLTGLAGEPAKAAAPPPPPPPPKGTVLYFSFDKAESGNVPDKSGSNNTGHITGAKWTAAGKLGGGCEFSGKGDYIQVADSESLHMKQGTFIAWFKTSKSDTIWRRILDKRAERGFALAIAGDAAGMQSKGKLAFTVNGCTPCLSDNTVVDGSWHHAAATFDGENLRLYVDGVLQKAVVPMKGEIVATHEPLTIGQNRYNPTPLENDQSFEGTLDEIMLVNRALSAEEIKAMIAVVIAADPVAAASKPKFTKQQVAGRLRELKYLFEQGLLTEDFYARKVAECEAAQ
ncbi:MAG TPA: LamG domain-containing protein [Planctomycetota bacterium]|nr:LamG domain-containing protein [Planctomycetota bacterium]